MFRHSLDGNFFSFQINFHYAHYNCLFLSLVEPSSIPDEQLDNINAELEKDIMIRAIHDVKGIDMGNSLVRYKAELDFDGRELTRFYLDKQDLTQLLEVSVVFIHIIGGVNFEINFGKKSSFLVFFCGQEVKSFSTVEELEKFLLKHGESIVDLMGGEIDRIELKLRVNIYSTIFNIHSISNFQ